jgi:hypothetical protein
VQYWPNDKSVRPVAARESCSIMRHALNQQGLPEDEHFFFRKEMGFNSEIGGRWQRLPYRLFGLVSEYGYSIYRPLIGLAILAFVSMMAIMIVLVAIEGTRTFGNGWALGGEAAALSVANSFPFLGLRRLYFPTDYFRDLPEFLRFWGGVQTFFSFVLLFFLGLGLRTRFRLR